MDRLIQSQLGRQPVNGCLIGMLAHQDGDRVAGYDPQHDKQQQGYQHQHQQRLKQSSHKTVLRSGSRIVSRQFFRTTSIA